MYFFNIYIYIYIYILLQILSQYFIEIKAKHYSWLILRESFDKMTKAYK